MSFGFSVGDFISAVALCRQIVENCITIADAPQSYQDFQNAARNLQAGLDQVLEVVSKRDKFPGTGSGSFSKSLNDDATISALLQIASDFSKTLGTIQLRLKQHPITPNSAFTRKMIYWFEAQDELQELVDRCKHHIVTINFLLEPLRTKILMDIRQSIIEVAGGVTNIEGGIQELQEMLVQFGCKPSEKGWAPTKIADPPAPNINEQDGLDKRFCMHLREDKGVDLKDIALLELTRSIVWWLEKGRINELDITKGTIGVVKYINLRKAFWMASRLAEHQTLLSSTDDKSFWHSYCQNLKKNVDEALKPIIDGTIVMPDLIEIHTENSSNFVVLIEFSVVETNDLNLARPDEDLILDISLPALGSSQAPPIRLMVFRQGTGFLRCVEIVRKTGPGVVRESTKEYIISRAEWNLRPFYAFSPETPCCNLALYNSKETKTFTFNNPTDLLAFQHAFTEGRVVYISSGFAPRPSLPPPEFKKIEWHEFGRKNKRKFTSGFLQLWLEKPRSPIQGSCSPIDGMSTKTPSTEESIPPLTVRSMTISSIATSNTVTTVRQDRKGVTVLTLNEVENTRLFACLTSETGTRLFINFTLGGNVTHRRTSCCTNYHIPTDTVPTHEDEICCLRLVLETVDGSKFPAQVLESSKNDDVSSLLGMPLDSKRLPVGSKTVKLVWFIVYFGSKTEKLRFIAHYHKLERIRMSKTQEKIELVSDIKVEEQKRGPVKSDDELSPLRRRSTGSSMFSFSARLRRATNRTY